MKKSIVRTDIETTVTPEGEVVSTDVRKTYIVKLDDTDRFFMVYFNMLQSFYEIKYLKDMKLLIKLIESAEYNTGKVSVTTQRRLDLCTELDVTSTNLSAGFKRLLDLNLISGTKGDYLINESAFWKGEANIRKGILKDKGLDILIKFQSSE